MNMHRRTYHGLALGLAGGILLASAAPAVAQLTGGMSSGLSGGLGSSGLGSSFGGPGFGGGGMSGGFGGASFSGGGFSGGSNFSGGAGFAGGTGFGGAGIAGARAGFGMAGATYGGTALWGPYLASPYAMGLQGGVNQIQHPFSETLRFGTPLYNTTGTTGYGTTGMGGSATLGTNNRGAFGSSIGIRRAPAYTVELGLGAAPPATTGPLQVRADLQDILARSSRLSPRDNIQVGMVGPVVVLRGTVLNDHDRRLAEGLIRLSPGVHDVRNELVIQGTTTSRP